MRRHRYNKEGDITKTHSSMPLSLPPITATVNKTASESSGLYLYKDEKGRIIINDVPNGTIFSNTNLQQSMEIVSVNGLGCEGMTDDFVKSLIDDASGEVTIVAREVVYEAVIVEEEGDIKVTPEPSAPLPPVATNVPQQQYHAQQQYQNQQLIQANNSSNPPQGCRDGGRWATIRYSGNNTFLICLVLAFCTGVFSLCGTCAFLCPQDRKNVYVVDNKVCYIHVCI
jgi:hypothetical protein